MYIYRMSSAIREILGVHVTACSRRLKIHGAYERSRLPNPAAQSINLMLLTGGQCDFRFADRTVRARAGEALLYENHALLEKLASSKGGMSYWFLSFFPLGAEGVLTLKETGLPGVCVPRNRSALARAFPVILKLFREKEPGWGQACSVTAMKILQNLLPATHAVFVDASGPDDRLPEKRIGDVLDFITENYKKRLGVGQLARVARMHPAHFNRLFRRATGLTPHRYVLERKVEKAKDFLLHYGESLTTTALELGFHDYSHFTRVFRRLTGMAPRQFLEKEGAGKLSFSRKGRMKWASR